MVAVYRWLIQLSICRGISMLKPVLGVACLCVTLAQAQSSDLAGQQINDLVAGATVEIDTPAGTKLRVRYARDGKLSGEAPSLAWYLGTASDHGRWWAASDQLCHKWNRWLNSEPQCMRLSKEGRVIRWRSHDGHSGTAMISVPASIQAAAAVVPFGQPSRAKHSVASETPPPAPQAAPAGQPAEPATDDSRPPQQAAVATALRVSPVPPSPVPASPVPPSPVPASPVQASPVPAPRAQVAALDKTAPPQDQAAAKSAAPPMFRVANVRSDDVLNVRSGPSADFEIVGALPPGSRGIAITSGCRSQWCPVQHHAASGWVNSAYLSPEEPLSQPVPLGPLGAAPEAPRACLTAPARALLERIERAFGPVQVVSTCRPGATVAGTWRASRHASGNAVDFRAGSRKAAIVAWLVANHRSGGTMTYAGTDHVHVDIGPHFVSIANGPHWRRAD
jgi:hypothetical protein